MTSIMIKISSVALIVSLLENWSYALAESACDYQLVETMPEKLTYNHDLEFKMAQTHLVYLDLINSATKSIQVASFYLSLLPEQSEHANHHSSEPGRLVFEALERAARERRIQVEVVIGKEGPGWSNQEELLRLREAGVDLKVLDVEKILGTGVMHSKFIITDDENFYLGSANWDWRALAQVKEFGISYKSCPVLAKDLLKIFRTYQLVSSQTVVPAELPDDLVTNINKNSTTTVIMDNINTNIYMGASPPMFNGANNHRSDDIDTLLSTIDEATKFVYISVMNYSPLAWKPRSYWPAIENALKRAVYDRRVQVKMSISKTDKPFKDYELAWYKSLDALNTNNPSIGGIEVRFFTVTTDDPFLTSIPHSRLKHDKYMVTDKSVYIGTSNWQKDYFTHTCGVGFSVTPDPRQLLEVSGRNIIADVKAIFERDFFSEHSTKVSDYIRSD